MTLTSNERRVLDALVDAGEADAQTLSDDTGLGRGPVEGALELLEDKGYAEVDESVETQHVLTEEGRRYAEDALPERRLHDFLVENDGATMDELRGLEGFEIGIGHLRGKGWADVGETVEPNDAPRGDDEEALEALAAGGEVDEVPETLIDRGLVESEEERTLRVRITEQGRGAAADETSEAVSELTHDLLASGDWKPSSPSTTSRRTPKRRTEDANTYSARWRTV